LAPLSAHKERGAAGSLGASGPEAPSGRALGSELVATSATFSDLGSVLSLAPVTER
jgi:hypothetical protein